MKLNLTKDIDTESNKVRVKSLPPPPPHPTTTKIKISQSVNTNFPQRCACLLHPRYVFLTTSCVHIYTGICQQNDVWNLLIKTWIIHEIEESRKKKSENYKSRWLHNFYRRQTSYIVFLILSLSFTVSHNFIFILHNGQNMKMITPQLKWIAKK